MIYFKIPVRISVRLTYTSNSSYIYYLLRIIVLFAFSVEQIATKSGSSVKSIAGFQGAVKVEFMTLQFW